MTKAQQAELLLRVKLYQLRRYLGELWPLALGVLVISGIVRVAWELWGWVLRLVF